MTVYFVRTRHTYEPYLDLFALATLSGFPVIYDDEIPQYDHPSAVFIVTWFSVSATEGQQPTTAGRVILWELEWYIPHPQVAVHETWAANRTYAEKIDAKFVPIGSHPDFAKAYPTVDNNKLYDACHLSYAIPRRETVYVDFMGRGGVLAANAWGADRHAILSQSRCMLYVAQHDNIPVIAPLRMALCAAYKLPLIAERSDWSIAPLSPGHLFTVDYALLGEIAHSLTRPKHWHELEYVGMSLYYLLCHSLPFRKVVEDAL